jgi:hypothetical protein
MAAPRLEFQDITFTIDVRGGAKKELLSGITGWCEPGTVTALSGPSGGGKTTLLDALAGAHYGGRLTGHVLVDGQLAHEWREANTAAYVHQHVRPWPPSGACSFVPACLPAAAGCSAPGAHGGALVAVPPALPEPAFAHLRPPSLRTHLTPPAALPAIRPAGRAAAVGHAA